MTIIEALEAALADGMFYISCDDYCDRIIETEINRLSSFTGPAVRLTQGYEYRDGHLTGPGGVSLLCQTADEVHAEREADE